MDGLDSNGRRRRRNPVEQGQTESSHADAALEAGSEDEMIQKNKKIRECPVPKPTGLMGQVLGFKQEQRTERPSVRIHNNEGND